MSCVRPETIPAAAVLAKICYTDVMRTCRMIPAPVARPAHSARIRCGVDPNGINQFGDSHLHRAAFFGQAGGLQLLLAAGGDPNNIKKTRPDPACIVLQSTGLPG